MNGHVLADAIAYFLITASCICLRTWAQAKMADWRGDLAPRAEGRLSMNPMVHYDEIGTVFIPLLSIALSGLGTDFSSIRPPVFGWGRQLNLNHPDPKKMGAHEMAIVGAALGMNLLLACIFSAVGALFGGAFPSVGQLCQIAIHVNVGLFVFHLLPIPPLDGAVFLKHLSGISEEAYTTYCQYSIWVFLGLMFLTPVGKGVSLLIFWFELPFQLFMR